MNSLTDRLPCPENGAQSCTDPDGSPWYGSGEINALDAVAWTRFDRSALVAGGTVQAGRAFSVYGVGFPWGIDVSLSVDGVDTGAVVMPFGKEQFHLDGRLPAETKPGAHTVTLTNNIGQAATANILVTAPIAAPEVTWPQAGDHAEPGRVTVSGRAVALAGVHVVVAEAATTADAGVNAVPIILDVAADSQGRFLADADLVAGRYEVRVSQTLTDGTESGVGEPTGFVVGDGGGTGPTPEPSPTPTAAPTPDPGGESGLDGGDASKRGGALASTGIGGAPAAIVGVLLLLAGGLVSAIVGQRRLARRDRCSGLDRTP
ncbi:hypothetical protein ACL9RL_17930 [Plantibacter sp. Mn2098]|uniref:hypothetical protein n=1 Tax=Plantibacter sp. Mn2098 TaxID=3395266 RepID=UPI003BECA804